MRTGLSCAIAIAMRFIHDFWALVVLLRYDQKAIDSFHNNNLLVWLI
jgi:hypothetical protein